MRNILQENQKNEISHDSVSEKDSTAKYRSSDNFSSYYCNFEIFNNAKYILSENLEQIQAEEAHHPSKVLASAKELTGICSPCFWNLQYFEEQLKVVRNFQRAAVFAAPILYNF